MIMTIVLSALFGGAVASFPLLKRGREIKNESLDKIEHRCKWTLLLPLLVVTVWLLFVLYRPSHAIVLIEVAVLAALWITSLRGILGGLFFLAPFSCGILGVLSYDTTKWLVYERLSVVLAVIVGFMDVFSVMFVGIAFDEDTTHIDNINWPNTHHRVIAAIITGVLISELVLHR